MHTHRLWLLSFLLATTAVAVAGCTPDYPSCETDKDCHDKEFCVARKCQQCRDSKDCPAGQSCNSGKCDAIPGYCKQQVGLSRGSGVHRQPVQGLCVER